MASMSRDMNSVFDELHLAVPVLGFGGARPEHLEVPLSAAPRLDDIGRDDIHEDLGKGSALGIVLEVVRLVVPDERRVEQERQKQIVAIVDHLELADWPLL